MRPMSNKRRRQIAARTAVRETKTARNQCAARIPDVCINRGPWEVNEVIRRSQWPLGYLVEGNTDCLCSPCHGYVTVNPEWAKANGLQKESTDRPGCDVDGCDAGADAVVADDSGTAWVCRRHQDVVDVAIEFGMLRLRPEVSE